jgi:hypothetical protein
LLGIAESNYRIRLAGIEAAVLHSRRQFKQLVRVAIHEWHVLNLFVLDRASKFWTGGVNERHAFRNGDGLADVSQLHRDVNASGNIDLQHDSAEYSFLEARFTDFDFVVAHGKQVEAVFPFGVGPRGTGKVGVGVGYRHLGIGHRATADF